MSDNLDTDAVKLLYEENGKNYRMFVEWRYKVLVRHLVTLGAMLFLAKYIHESGVFKFWAFVPIFIGAGFSKLSGMMDLRNKALFDNCKSIGSSLEHKLGMNGQGFYSHLSSKKSKYSYGEVLSSIYNWSFWVFLFIGFIVTIYTLKTIFN